MRKLIVLVGILAMVSPAWADYTSTVKADNPLSFWEFEDATCNNGDAAADSMGVENGKYTIRNGVGTLALVNAAGIGKSLQINNASASGGNGAFVDVPDNSYWSYGGVTYRLESSTSCTIEFAYKGSVPSGQYPRFVQHAQGGTGNYDISAGYNASGDQMAIGGAGGTWYSWPPVAADNKWHLIDVTYAYDGTNTTKSLYIDGAYKSSNSIAGALAPPDNWSDLLIGAEGNQNYIYNAYTGLVDEVAYYNVALNGTQVGAHFAAFPEPTTIALLGLGLALLRKRS